MTERLHLATHSSVLAWRTPGKRFLDRGAWWAAVYGVAQRWTRPEQFSSSRRSILFIGHLLGTLTRKQSQLELLYRCKAYSFVNISFYLSLSCHPYPHPRNPASLPRTIPVSPHSNFLVFKAPGGSPSPSQSDLPRSSP